MDTAKTSACFPLPCPELQTHSLTIKQQNICSSPDTTPQLGFQTQQESLHSCTDLCLLSNISNPISVLCPSPHPEICGSGGSKASKSSRCFPSQLLYGLTKTRSADMTQELDESKSFLQGWWHRAFPKSVWSFLHNSLPSMHRQSFSSHSFSRLNIHQSKGKIIKCKARSSQTAEINYSHLNSAREEFPFVLW